MDALVACGMMGYVIHPNDWEAKVNNPGSPDMNILRSNVDCTDLDDDLLECWAELEVEHPCTHSRDVYLKCHLPSWAGESKQKLIRWVVSHSSHVSNSSYQTLRCEFCGHRSLGKNETRHHRRGRSPGPKHPLLRSCPQNRLQCTFFEQSGHWKQCRWRHAHHEKWCETIFFWSQYLFRSGRIRFWKMNF